MTPLRVVLASASPRRTELLTLIGIPHTVRAMHVEERVAPGESPEVYAERLARDKAAACTAVEGEAALIVGADTIVLVDDAILEKPRDAADAVRMLRLLSGRVHTVLTAVAVSRGGRVVSGVERVAVRFRALSDETIRAYVATGEPMDKAGAYGIQGFGATLVEGIDGDYFAVMGLALGRLVGLMAEMGVEYRFGAPAARG